MPPLFFTITPIASRMDFINLNAALKAEPLKFRHVKKDCKRSSTLSLLWAHIGRIRNKHFFE
jgi:hypothetical protein